MARIQELATEFDDLCIERHRGIGKEQYGNFKFLGNEHLLTDIFEELADAANYLRYMYIRLRLMGEALEGRNDSTPFVSNAEHSDGLDIGPSTFIASE